MAQYDQDHDDTSGKSLNYDCPPQDPFVFNATPDSILQDAKIMIKTRRARLDKIAAAFTPETATFEGVIESIAQDYDAGMTFSLPLRVYKSVSPLPEVRNAAVAALKLLNAFETEFYSREDIFALCDALYRRRSLLGLDTENLRYLEKLHKRQVMSGMGIPPGHEREALKQARIRLGNVANEFTKNLNDENDCLWLTTEELDGVPTTLLCKLDRGTDVNEGQLRLKLGRTHTLPVLKYAVKPEVRRQVLLARENRCENNRALFHEAILLRDHIARSLGYANHAALRTEDMMIKSSAAVDDFLEQFRAVLLPQAQVELNTMQQLKAQYCKNHGILDDGNYYEWDFRFYERLFLEQHHELDEMVIAEYFPLEATVAGMLATFERLMGFVFVKMEDTNNSQSDTGTVADLTWHPEVIMYSVWNDDLGGNDFIGYLYFDMHPRPGKYSHCCTSIIQPGFTRADGTRHYPSTAVICSFTTPTPERPSLLNHREVVTLFHEMGHAIHCLASKTRHSMLHGTATTRDFVEAPSQMLENWYWIPDVLTRVSKHWKTGEHLPADLANRIARSKNVNRASRMLRDMRIGVFDMICHAPKTHSELVALDLARVYNETAQRISLVKGADPGVDISQLGHGYATFSHLNTAYAAGYYSYQYSEAISTAMFHAAFRKDPMDEQQGRRYRHTVLEPGASLDERDIVEKFLGKALNVEAFYQEFQAASSLDG